MKENEAVRVLEMHNVFLKDNWKPHPDYKVLEAIGIAIPAIKKRIARGAVRKLNPDEGNRTYHYCPVCAELLTRVSNYCPNCGQKPTWER